VGWAGKADAKNTTRMGGDFLAALCMALTAGAGYFCVFKGQKEVSLQKQNRSNN